MIAEARDLYALDPGEFIAARNQLSKTLRADGRADDAAVVAALRRPKLAEYALNRVANTDGSAMQRLSAAVAAAEQAQASAIGQGAAGLRAATTELRTAMSAVVELAVRALSAGGASGEGQRDEIVALIREHIAASDMAPLRDGVVGAAAVAGPADVFGGITAATDVGTASSRHPASRPAAVPKATAPKPSEPKPTGPTRVGQKSSGPKDVAPVAGPSPAEARAAARRQREHDERAARLYGRLSAAQDALETARRATREATAAAEAAKDAVAEALRQQVRAERHLTTTRDHLDDATARVAAAQQAVRDFEAVRPS